MGDSLRAIASACIDLSDGLLADLPRLAESSGCGARICTSEQPAGIGRRSGERAGEAAWQHALAGGEDYELCLAAPTQRAAELDFGSWPTRLDRATQPLRPVAAGARPGAAASCAAVIQFSQSRFDHFAS